MSKARTPAVSLKAPASPATAPNGGKAKTATTTPAAAPGTKPNPHAFTPNPTQELLLQTCADAILRGTHVGILENLLLALGQHYYYKRFGYGSEDTRYNKSVADAERYLDERMRRVQGAWPTPERPSNYDAPPDVSDHLRLKVRSDILYRLNELFTDGSPEEHRLLADILQDRTSETWFADDDPQVPLGYCFQLQLDREGRYLHIPDERRWKLVQQYLRLLDKAEAACGCEEDAA
jgi:hypothetical protein